MKFNLLKTVAITVMTALIATSASANDFVNVGVELLSNENGQQTTTADVAWRKGKLSGYSFFDDTSNGFSLNNNAVNLDLANIDQIGTVFAATEFGTGTPGSQFKAGLGVATGKVPGTKFVTATYFPYASGADVDQIRVVWATKDLEVGKLNFFSTGFYRLKSDAPDIYQPRLQMSHDDIPGVSVGVEFEGFGKDAPAAAMVRLEPFKLFK